MQVKMTIEEFVNSEFSPGSHPARQTVVNRIKAGIYRGIKEGRHWYILKDVGTGDKRADEILRKYGTA